ncbi:NfeD family protein [Nocardioides caldifontis]|uniref:NfeD family protein n=1 Tax=Nocardioides caldifontis TaxID=2588938 RepID=UPI0011DF3F1F|nr:NfeD family protein [Nocardioides caldifontis]
MTVFLVLGVVGLVLLGVSLVLGDVLDGALDVVAGDAFSTAVIGAFVSAFGFGAAAVEAAGFGMVVALPVGLVAGVAFGWFAAWLTRLLRGGGTDAPPSTADTVGREGQVVTGIPAEGFGVVRVYVDGQLLRLNARADSAIEVGTAVHVTGVLSPTAVTVAPVWNELP